MGLSPPSLYSLPSPSSARSPFHSRDSQPHASIPGWSSPSSCSYHFHRKDSTNLCIHFHHLNSIHYYHYHYSLKFTMILSRALSFIFSGVIFSYSSPLSEDSSLDSSSLLSSSDSSESDSSLSSSSSSAFTSTVS